MRYVIFFIWLMTSIWAASDAGKRSKSRFLVFLLVFLTGPIGLIIWLIFRPEYRTPTFKDPF